MSLSYRNKSMDWCSSFHYCTISFYKFWTQVLRRFKPCSWRVRDLRWWESLTVVLTGNNASCLFRLSIIPQKQSIIIIIIIIIKTKEIYSRKEDCLGEYFPIFRSSLSQMFNKVGVSRTFANFKRKYLCWSYFLINF